PRSRLRPVQESSSGREDPIVGKRGKDRLPGEELRHIARLLIEQSLLRIHLTGRLPSSVLSLRGVLSKQ
ncbi:MAG TPA: hypothetical protein PLM33_03970, partial [Acidobacteriota bacterium]|nr:hypothetical protein [Acidobacteriota bacterium]